MCEVQGKLFGKVAAVMCFIMAHTERARRRCLRGSFLSVNSYQQSWVLGCCGSKHQQLRSNFRLPDDGRKNLARLYIAPTEAPLYAAQMQRTALKFRSATREMLHKCPSPGCNSPLAQQVVLCSGHLPCLLTQVSGTYAKIPPRRGACARRRRCRRSPQRAPAAAAASPHSAATAPTHNPAQDDKHLSYSSCCSTLRSAIRSARGLCAMTNRERS